MFAGTGMLGTPSGKPQSEEAIDRLSRLLKSLISMASNYVARFSLYFRCDSYHTIHPYCVRLSNVIHIALFFETFCYVNFVYLWDLAIKVMLQRRFLSQRYTKVSIYYIKSLRNVNKYEIISTDEHLNVS